MNRHQKKGKKRDIEDLTVYVISSVEGQWDGVMIIVVLSDRCVILDTAGNPYYIDNLIVQASGYFDISHAVCIFLYQLL